MSPRRAAPLGALLLLATSASAKPPLPTIEQRLAELASTLRCNDASADDPERHLGCLVAQHWAEAKADPLPPGYTALIGATIEVPDKRSTDWRPETIPAVGGIRVEASRAYICENDMVPVGPSDRLIIAEVRGALQRALATLTAPLVASPVVIGWANQRAAHAPSPLSRHGGSWTTRFQGAVELRHLGKRWFLIEQRRGNSGLWVSAFTAEFSAGLSL